MSPKSRREWLDAVVPRYRRASKKEKGKILDEFCAVSGWGRKHAIRRMGRWRRRKPKPARVRRGRPPVYGGEELRVLKTIWLASEQLCSKRLKAALGLWLPFYEKRHGDLDPQVRERLLAMSSATMDRLLEPVRVKGRKGRCATRPATKLKNQIPIRAERWDVHGPGWFEADTVAHCGNSLAGDFVWSLTFTDIWSGWTEMRAVWNRGAEGVLGRISDIEKRLVFPILGVDCDNGSEFLNHHLWNYLANRKKPVKFTRSRPYHKNDQAHVEQKNWTHVRQLLGYDRLADPRMIEPINALYGGPWSQLHNFFCPSMKLVSKERVGAQYRKKYDRPQTPYQRLMASEMLGEKEKKKLRIVYIRLDPFALKRGIENGLKKLRNIRIEEGSMSQQPSTEKKSALGVLY